MYSAMIVEDEMLVRVGLKSLINWNELGLALISDASNGQEALDKYDQCKPDIIITDIRMPQMDGIELVKKIRQTDRRVRIIILTCLEEFELIKKAMELDVDGYIVKLTMTSKEMADVLRRAIGRLNELGPPDKKASVQNRHSLDEQIGELCKEYFDESKITPEDFERSLSELRIRLKGKKTVLSLLQIDHYGILHGKHEKNGGKQLDTSILSIIEAVTKKNLTCYAVNINPSKYMLFFIIEGIASESKINSVIGNVIVNIKNSLKRYFDMSVSFGVSTIWNDAGKPDAIHMEAAAALDLRFFGGTGTINYYNEQESKRMIREKLDRLLAHPPLLEILGCTEEYKKRVGNFISKGDFQIENVRNFFIHLLQMTALSSRFDKKVFEDIVISYNGIIYECETFNEMYATYEDFIGSAVNRSKEQVSYSKGIGEAIEYIKRHYNEEISLNQLAGLVNLSPNYFSTLFKRELDLNFSEYIINYRIEKAKELLLGTRLLSYEISQRVGFMDGAYFSRTFKKATGLTPNEYRKKLFER